MRAAALLAIAAACASGRSSGSVDAADPVDGGEVDAAAADAAAPDAATDAAITDAATDARVADGAIDAPPLDAAIDAVPIDAACTPTWQNLIGNGDFETGVTPWTQTSTIIRTAAQMPFAPQAGMYSALFGAANNANDVLVQTVTIPASATGLRLRGYECHVTEDLIAMTDSFRVTVETPAGTVLETLRSITNSDVAPICIWLPFTWTAAAAHPGQQVVLRLQGRTNLAFLTRFVVDGLAFEALTCP
jgi:hypothetical protein